MSGLAAAFRRELPIYGAGMFSNSNVTISSLIVPLWAVQLGISPTVIGVLLGVRHVPGLLFSIHGGVLMDRLGARTLMVFFAGMAVVVPLLFPLMPWIWAMVVLQMAWGLATTMTWIGAQTAVSQFMRGSTRHAGRLSVSVRIGMLGGPPLAGWGWDTWGPWGGFAVISIWAIGLFASCCMLPRADAATLPDVREFRMSDILPRGADYVAAFRMLSVPALSLCVYLSTIRIGSYGIQESFYVVYLEEIGLSGKQIGLLAGTAHSFLGAVGALVVGLAPAMGTMRTQLAFFLVTLIIAVVLIAATPLMSDFWPLFAAIALRGLLLGFNQPLMISVMAQASDPGTQGMTVGLRTTANRAASTVVPVAMGATADIVGLANSFYVIGGFLVLCCGATAVLLVRGSARGHFG